MREGLHSVLGRLRHDPQNISPHKLTSIVYIYIYTVESTYIHIQPLHQSCFWCNVLPFATSIHVNNRNPHVNVLEVYHLSHLNPTRPRFPSWNVHRCPRNAPDAWLRWDKYVSTKGRILVAGFWWRVGVDFLNSKMKMIWIDEFWWDDFCAKMDFGLEIMYFIWCIQYTLRIYKIRQQVRGKTQYRHKDLGYRNNFHLN